MIKALATCLTVIALAGCVTPVQRTASGDIPPARVYIKSMTQQAPGLAQVEFSRTAGLLNNEMLELAINDVVLAQISGGEHLTIWLNPGSYEFSVKPVHSLNTPASATGSRITLVLTKDGSQKVVIASDVRGPKMQAAQ